MSWSVSSVGKPEAVKRAIATQFEAAKKSTAQFPHECESVAMVEQLVNGQLDYLINDTKMAVQVTASGSCYQHGANFSTQVKVELTPLYGFAE